MHLLLRHGAVLPASLPVRDDAAGVQLLAELYALPRDAVRVRAMMNTTIDGAVVGADGTSGPLRNPDDSLVFSVLRALADVVLVGAQTARAEDYTQVQGHAGLLTPSRRPGGGDRPVLAILSRSGELPRGVDPDGTTLLITPAAGAKDAAERSGLPRERVLGADTPQQVIALLAARGLRGIQAEGGPSTLGWLLHAGVLDELCLSTTHRTVGGDSPPVLRAPVLDQPWQLRSLLVGEHASSSRYTRPA
ncbi:dihydrofolate reductase family protein [Brachybacterium sp. Marseille-Q7125]|uniref:dihydrofolate reductase family protein n=1 Tax=Brachybacterium sp. Marseille-Q7125 TaxID=2932815 RepID=UPI001FF643B8|nr:dihydrofolate reductase family protein [Brachybacterium sp. Marseille-Q7125]